MHRFIHINYRDGPFYYYTLTDLQQNNIFVDDFSGTFRPLLTSSGRSRNPWKCSFLPARSRPNRSTPSMMLNLSPSWALYSMSILTSTKPMKWLEMAFCFTVPSCAMYGKQVAFGTSTQSRYPKACIGSSMPVSSLCSTRDIAVDLFSTRSSFGIGGLVPRDLSKRNSRIRRTMSRRLKKPLGRRCNN